MATHDNRTMANRLVEKTQNLTPLGRQLVDYLMNNPKESIFLSARELAEKNNVSLATVVRFVRQLGYSSYRDFLKDMREQIDTRMPLPERLEIHKNGSDLRQRIEREISAEIENLRDLKSHLDLELLELIADRIWAAPQVYAVGARMSLSISCYFSWALSRIRSRVTNLDGGNRNSLDWITLCPKNSLVIIFTVMRYPNDLLRLARLAQQQDRDLVVIADSRSCPLFQFTEHCLTVPCQNFPIVGSPSALGCVVNCIIYAMICNHSEEINKHQNILEQLYRENDIFFNPNDRGRVIKEI
ncbi:MAG: MurR/RpiR family transcriptional regulator [Nitrospinales bacterium]